MRHLLIVGMAAALVTSAAHAAEKTPEITVVDGKVSVQVEAVPLGRFLSLLDRATGLTSNVKVSDLQNRPIHVRFSNLEVGAAVRKIFQGTNLDYIFVEGQGIIVTGTSQAVTNAPASGVSPFEDRAQTPSRSPDFVPDQPAGRGAAPIAPVIPGAVGAAGQNQPPNVPLGMPGATVPGNSLFGNTVPPPFTNAPASMNPSSTPFPTTSPTPGANPPNPQQPTVIQTPFGPIQAVPAPGPAK